ncbi:MULTISPECIES: hydrogenase maturation protease [unclassified Streptomyces]|uniref:hydrogenase maturation protease n=1 Tax=unclassified Streptomyces TaxID=2593676 RepID=UPI000DC7E356|nr:MULTISPECIES: hydrogenase maturation protease [unclassified Streptomyces]AWZ04757.1 protease [Streptomyces sp. ICC4]AWZ12301.1 protease [Streptomyces sp. ICC1]
MSGRILIAGIGNVFLGDDGFGVETLRQLSAYELPDQVEAVDFGVRGMHLAYQLLDGYDTLVLADATARGGAPGTLYLIEADEPGSVQPGAALLDGHHMSPDAVLALLGTLCEGTGTNPPRRILVVGCEPASIAEGIGLSGPVAAAVPEAVRMILGLLRDELEDRGPGDHGREGQGREGQGPEDHDHEDHDVVAAPVAELRRTP